MAGSKTSRGPVRGAGIPRLAGGETSQLARHLQENPTPSTFSILQQGRLNAATHGSKTPKAEQARSRCSECIGLVMGPRGRGGLEFGGVVRGPNPNFQTKVQTTAATTTIPQAFVIQVQIWSSRGLCLFHGIVRSWDLLSTVCWSCCLHRAANEAS